MSATKDYNVSLNILGGIKASDLSGSGTEMVTADNDGLLQTQSIPSPSDATITLSRGANTIDTFTLDQPNNKTIDLGNGGLSAGVSTNISASDNIDAIWTTVQW